MNTSPSSFEGRFANAFIPPNVIVENFEKINAVVCYCA